MSFRCDMPDFAVEMITINRLSTAHKFITFLLSHFNLIHIIKNVLAYTHIPYAPGQSNNHFCVK